MLLLDACFVRRFLFYLNRGISNSRPGINNIILMRLRVEPHFESEKRSTGEWIVSVPKCPIHGARYAFCDDSPLRPLISLSRVSMSSCTHTPAMEAKKSAHGMKIWLSWSEWWKPLSIVCGTTVNLTKTMFILVYSLAMGRVSVFQVNLMSSHGRTWPESHPLMNRHHFCFKKIVQNKPRHRDDSLRYL